MFFIIIYLILFKNYVLFEKFISRVHTLQYDYFK